MRRGGGRAAVRPDLVVRGRHRAELRGGRFSRSCWHGRVRLSQTRRVPWSEEEYRKEDPRGAGGLAADVGAFRRTGQPLRRQYLGPRSPMSTCLETTPCRCGYPADSKSPIAVVKASSRDFRTGKSMSPRLHGTFVSANGWKVQSQRSIRTMQPTGETRCFFVRPDHQFLGYLARLFPCMYPEKGIRKCWPRPQGKPPAITDGNTYPSVSSQVLSLALSPEYRKRISRGRIRRHLARRHRIHVRLRRHQSHQQRQGRTGLWQGLLSGRA